MTVLSAVKTYIQDYSELETDAPVWVNYLGKDPIEYAIIPLPGAGVVEEYIDGSSKREFSFAFQSMESTADELERLETIGFFEEFSEWLDTQTEADDFPSLESGKTPTKIEALGWGFLYEQGESGTGVYQIQCALTYDQD